MHGYVNVEVDEVKDDNAKDPFDDNKIYLIEMSLCCQSHKGVPK